MRRAPFRTPGDPFAGAGQNICSNRSIPTKAHFVKLIGHHHHGTRKTHATLALVAGLPLQVVQARLDHRTPKTLLAHYAAITTAMEERAAEVFDGLLAAAHGGNR